MRNRNPHAIAESTLTLVAMMMVVVVDGSPCNETSIGALTDAATLETMYDEYMYDIYRGCGTKSAATFVAAATIPLLPWKFTNVTACFMTAADANVTASIVLFLMDNATGTVANATHGMPTPEPAAETTPQTVFFAYRNPSENLYCFSADLSGRDDFVVRSSETSSSTVWLGVRYSTCNDTTSVFLLPSRLDWPEMKTPNRYQLYPDSVDWIAEHSAVAETFVVVWSGTAICESPPSSSSSSHLSSSTSSTGARSSASASTIESSSLGVESSSLPSSETSSDASSSDSRGVAGTDDGGVATEVIVAIAVAGGVAIVAISATVAVACLVRRSKRRKGDAERGDGRSVIYATEMVPTFDNPSETIGSVSAFSSASTSSSAGASLGKDATILATPRYENEASKFAFAELELGGDDDADSLTTCGMSELLSIEPRNPTFGKMSVDDPTAAETKVTISHAAGEKCAVSVFVVGFGGKAFRIAFPTKYDKEGTAVAEVTFVRERLLPKERIEIVVRATACCSTSTTSPKLFVAAKTEPLRALKRRASTQRRKSSAASLGPDSAENEEEDGNKKVGNGSFAGKKSTKVVRMHAQVAPSPKLDPDEFEDFSQVGEGASGRVFRARWKRGNQTVAIKTFKQVGVSPEMLKDITNEANIQSNLKNPYIVTFFGIVVGDQLAMVTEFFPLGGLDKMLEKATSDPSGVGAEMTLALRIRYGIDIARGMDYLASSNIVHRDLKPGNVLVASTNTTSDSPCCKITDFGTARTAIDSDDVSATCTKGVGTPIFMAPEVLTYDKTKPCYTEASDVYSYSILCYQLFSGLDPFPSEKYSSPWKVSDAVTSGKRPNMAAFAGSSVCAGAAKELASVVEACWAQNPEDRPKFAAIVETLSNVIPAPV